MNSPHTPFIPAKAGNQAQQECASFARSLCAGYPVKLGMSGKELGSNS